MVAAWDINHLAIEVYRHNFPATHQPQVRLIDGLPGSELARYQADLWWMSPPCQPFTRRGLGRDLEDPRTRTFRAALSGVAAVRPRYLAFENVVGFERSSAHELLRFTLESAGYTAIAEWTLCPSELGWPNRRPRFYLIASREPLGAPDLSPVDQRLCDLIDAEPAPGLAVDRAMVERYGFALDRVHAADPQALTACFTSAYGRSWVRSGSYLSTEAGAGLRRFAPGEILRLLGFPPSFGLPPNLSRANAWRLVGNSLSLPAVRAVLSAIPELAASHRGINSDRISPPHP